MTFASTLQNKKPLEFLFLSIGVTMIVLAFCLLLMRNAAGQSDNKDSAIRKLFIIGLIGVFSGYVMYIPTSVAFSSSRPLLFSSPWAAVAVTSGIFLLTRQPITWRLIVAFSLVLLFTILSNFSLYSIILAFLVVSLLISSSRLMPIIISVLLIFLSNLFTLSQHLEFSKRYVDSVKSIFPVIEQVQGFSQPKTVLLLIDQKRDSELSNNFGENRELNYALTLILDDITLTARNCWDTPPNLCRFTLEGVRTVGEFGSGEEFYPYSRIVALRYEPAQKRFGFLATPPIDWPEASTSTYRPDERASKSRALPPRLYTMFNFQDIVPYYEHLWDK